MNMGRFISLHWLACVLILILHPKIAYSSSSSSLYSNVSSSSSSARWLCSHEESSALLQFKRTFILNFSASYHSNDCESDYGGGCYPTTVRSFPKTKYWKMESDCCSWSGVTCNEVSGHVIKLDLSFSELQGAIYSNSSLFQLSHLQTLNLAFNDFMGSEISFGFGQFAGLTYLNLSYSNFSGELASDISNLSKLVSLDLSTVFPRPGSSPCGQICLINFDILLQHLTELQTLVLDGVDLSTLFFSDSYPRRNLSSSPFSNSLTHLSLRRSVLPEDIFNWPYFRGVDILDLYGAMFTEKTLVSIGSLESLKFLNLSSTTSSIGLVPKGIGNLTKLTHLDLSSSGLYGQVSSTIFSNLDQLEFLDMSSNQLEGQIPNSFANQTKLIHLDLSSNVLSGQFSSTIFSNVEKLEFLDLSDNSLEGQIPNSFANLNKLKVLRLDSNGFTGGFPSSFANLSQLNHLNISNNNLTLIPVSTTGFQQISVMNLSSNSLKGTIPSWLFDRPSLVTLDLSDNQLIGKISPQIGKLLNLSQLDLSSNLIGGMIPPALFSLPSLETLDIGDNSLFGLIPSNITGLQKLHFLRLSNNTLNGTIPSALLSLPSLTSLDLSMNKLTGHVGEFQSNLLEYIDLSNNDLQGANFSSISNLVNLTALDLSSNNLTGTLDLDVFLSLQKLEILYLSDNSHLSLLSGDKVGSPLPKLTLLGLSSCNVSSFPYFLKNLVQLERLSLSNNKIRGPIPEWLNDMGKSSLQYLNLSNNFLTSSLEILPWGNIAQVDLSFNLLEGVLPVPPTTTQVYLISNNKLSGEIQPRICNVSQLWIVDFSNNTLSGNIPDCLFNKESISVLNLRENNLSGTIPGYNTSGTIPTIPGFGLTILDLGHNQLEGHIPRSLASCTNLVVLDLGYNFISDTFPSWMETMPKLQILVLRANRFYGNIAKSRHASGFTKLSVIDLSYNKFTGNLPSDYFHSWKSMMITSHDESQYDSVQQFGYYSQSTTLANKGSFMELVETLSIFKAADFSNNKFDGKIPESIGDLKLLIVLNLSSNGLTGEIPASLGNLNQLQSLDFSNNKLSGRIPAQLNSLTFLGAFNVSQNNLEGPIPQTGQLSTFPYDSYKANPGLCGIPLPKKCEEIQVSPPPILSYYEQEKDSDMLLDGFNWKSVTIGYGCGAIIGIVIGNIIIARNEEWVLSIFNIRLLWRIKRSNNA